MPLLYMETDQVRAAGSQLTQIIGELSSQADSLAASASSLESAWVSDGSSLFLQDYTGLISTIRQLAEVGDSFRARIETEVAEWEQVANNYQSIGIHPMTSSAEMDYYKRLSQFVRLQEPGNTCALFSEMITMQALGKNVSFDEIKKLGARVGYFDLPGKAFDGSRFGIGQVWKHYEIPFETFQLKENPIEKTINSVVLNGSGFYDASDRQQATDYLLSRLQDHKAVIVGVEARYLYPDDVKGLLTGHQVWVAGIIKDSNGIPSSVILNDTGWGEQKTVPFDKFMQAWEWQKFQSVASENPINLP